MFWVGLIFFPPFFIENVKIVLLGHNKGIVFLGHNKGIVLLGRNKGR